MEDGDEYVINGQKIWSSYAQYADHMFLLARTDTSAVKHRGITFLLLDMDTPGITVRPIQEMSGESSFNEEFFDNVRIPKQNVLGEVNRGWYVAMTLLDFERTGINHPAGGKRILDLLIQYAKETSHNGKPLAADPRIRHKLADVAVSLETSRMMAYRIAWMQGEGMVPNMEASLLRLISSADVSETGSRGDGGYGFEGTAGERLQVRRAAGVRLATVPVLRALHHRVGLTGDPTQRSRNPWPRAPAGGIGGCPTQVGGFPKLPSPAGCTIRAIAHLFLARLNPYHSEAPLGRRCDLGLNVGHLQSPQSL